MTNPLQELISETELTHATMDKVSDTIKKVESTLQNIKLHFPFSLELKSFDAGLSGSLTWEKSGEKYRICYSDETVTKPLAEMPFAVRHKCYPHLFKFIEELTKYIAKLREDIQGINRIKDNE